MIGKEGRDECYLKKLETNVDIKILTKVLATCMKKVVSSVIANDEQSMFQGGT